MKAHTGDAHGHIVSQKIPYCAIELDTRRTMTASMQNSTFWDWTKDAIDMRHSIPVQLDLNVDNFASVAEEKGISTNSPVILYDDGRSGSMFACRYVRVLWPQSM